VRSGHYRVIRPAGQESQPACDGSLAVHHRGTATHHSKHVVHLTLDALTVDRVRVTNLFLTQILRLVARKQPSVTFRLERVCARREDAGMLARTLLAISLVVRVYDNVGVANADMEAALAAAHATLKNAGIEVMWRVGQVGRVGQVSQDGPELIVRIVDAPPGSRPDSLGFSFVDTGTKAGTLATIFDDRVGALSARSGANRGQLLGRSMAHEIGHLLLGTTHHADRGLMRGVWSTIDLQKNQPLDWMLSSEEGARMRRAVALRLRRAEPPVAIVAKQ
jgi:hypothetical protein